MRKIVICIILLSIIIGCDSTNNSFKKTYIKRTPERIFNLNEQEYEIEGQDELFEIIHPLLPGVVIEEEMIEYVILKSRKGSEFREEALEELKEFMLTYYTEELSNETCELISYKLGLEIEMEKFTVHSNGDFKRNGSISSIYNAVTYGQENIDFSHFKPEVKEVNLDDFTIMSVERNSRDRIKIELKMNVKNEGDRLFWLVLEKEGTVWYIRELVFSRNKITELGQVY